MSEEIPPLTLDRWRMQLRGEPIGLDVYYAEALADGADFKQSPDGEWHIRNQSDPAHWGTPGFDKREPALGYCHGRDYLTYRLRAWDRLRERYLAGNA